MVLIGFCLVSVAFVLLRFCFNCPKNIWERLNPTSRNLLFYSQQIIYWGLLITGLVLCFLSSIKIGLLTLGCFLVLYYKSIDYLASGKGIPLLHNLLAGLVGITSLLLGLILSFTTSLKYGLVSIGCIVLSFLIVKCLMIIELNIIQKKI